MIGIPETGTLERACVFANINSGYQIRTADGRPARLAIIDERGAVIEAGAAVAAEAWNVCIAVQKNFWIGQGHLVIHRGPPGTGCISFAQQTKTPRTASTSRPRLAAPKSEGKKQ